MQCKDIPDLPILEFLKSLNGRMAVNGGFKGCPPYSVSKSMPGGISDKLIRAKMGQLIKRGLVSGCTCGCRGDYVLTENGRKLLFPPQEEHPTQAEWDELRARVHRLKIGAQEPFGYHYK